VCPALTKTEKKKKKKKKKGYGEGGTVSGGWKAGDSCHG